MSDLLNATTCEAIITSAWAYEPNLRAPKIRRLLAKIISLHFGVETRIGLLPAHTKVSTKYEILITGQSSRVRAARVAFGDLSYESLRAIHDFSKLEKERIEHNLRLERKKAKKEGREFKKVSSKTLLKQHVLLFLEGYLLTILSKIKVVTLSSQERTQLDLYLKQHQSEIGVRECDLAPFKVSAFEQDLREKGRLYALSSNVTFKIFG